MLGTIIKKKVQLDEIHSDEQHLVIKLIISALLQQQNLKLELQLGKIFAW